MPEIPVEVLEEINDPGYLNRVHGRPATYNAGCRGPLCRKMNRDRARQVYEKSQIQSGKEVKSYGPRADLVEEIVLEIAQNWYLKGLEGDDLVAV